MAEDFLSLDAIGIGGEDDWHAQGDSNFAQEGTLHTRDGQTRLITPEFGGLKRVVFDSNGNTTVFDYSHELTDGGSVYAPSESKKS